LCAPSHSAHSMISEFFTDDLSNVRSLSAACPGERDGCGRDHRIGDRDGKMHRAYDSR
jgi:hypothetical protein